MCINVRFRDKLILKLRPVQNEKQQYKHTISVVIIRRSVIVGRNLDYLLFSFLFVTIRKVAQWDQNGFERPQCQKIQ